MIGEVISGDEFVKFRHTDEILLRNKLDLMFDGRPPVLVLGHTHEVRKNAVDEAGRPFHFYANSGAVGRFEKLIWALEIVNGESRVVAWTGTPVRRLVFEVAGDVLRRMPTAPRL